MSGAIGLVVALNAEARALVGRGPWEHADGVVFRRSRLTDSTTLIVVRSGMGSENAATASQWLIRKGVSALGVSGVSGGLAPELLPGDLVLPEAVIQEHGNQMWEVSPGFVHMTSAALMHEGISAYRGPIITVLRPVLSARDKHTLFVKSKALAVDMESATVAAVAKSGGIPFFALRAVCDAAGHSIPGDLLVCVHQQGRVRLFQLFQSLFVKPALVSDLLRMKRDFGAALAGIGRGWRLAIRDILPSLLPPTGTPRM